MQEEEEEEEKKNKRTMSTAVILITNFLHIAQAGDTVLGETSVSHVFDVPRDDGL